MVLSLYSRIRYHSTYNCMNIKLHSCIFYSYLSLTHRTKKLAFLQFVNVILYNVYESRDSNTNLREVAIKSQCSISSPFLHNQIRLSANNAD